MRPQAAGEQLVTTLQDEADRLKTRFRAFSESRTVVVPAEAGETTVVLTETVALDGARKSDIDWLRKKYGLVTVAEGSHGKMLMRVPDAADDPVEYAAEAALAMHERGGPSAAHPNFLRVVQRTRVPAAPPGAPQWALDNAGKPGVIGADVGALGAWTVTKGSAQVRVAVLDEGVDTAHPFLAPAVVAERDFVDNNAHARPDGDDAHGTACAGIVLSRNRDVSGLAPDTSLVAARIAKSDAQGFWVFDDFDTADAIDWCWDDARLTCSRTLGAEDRRAGDNPCVRACAHQRPRRARRRRRRRGRKRTEGRRLPRQSGDRPDRRCLQSVGQAQDEVLGGRRELVGIELRYRTRRDGARSGDRHDRHRGARGYSGSQTTKTFNGTSSATPFVAATAALMISLNPGLTETRVREIVQGTTDPLGTSRTWNKYTGHGRIDAYAAARAARRG